MAINFHFDNVVYRARDSASGDRGDPAAAGPLPLLGGLSGQFTGGRLTCLLGPSGAGKTTLIDVLSGYRERGLASGTFQLTGRGPGTLDSTADSLTATTRRQLIGYCRQDESLFPELTVTETLRYAAAFRQSPAVRNGHRTVEDTLRLLALDGPTVRDARVAVLSGGERKRLAIGLELVGERRILFLDEPTTGLDSCTALAILKHLRELAGGDPACPRIVLCVIHQPNSALFRLFEEVFVLRRGRFLYRGPIGAPLERTLDQAGVQHCPLSYNPADYVLELACREETDPAVQYLLEQFASPSRRPTPVPVPFLSSPETPTPNGTVDGNRRMSIALLLGRVLFQIVGSVLFGLLMYGVANDAEKTMQSVSSVFVQLVMVWIANATTTVTVTVAELPIAGKEYARGWYSTGAYFLSLVAFQLPITALGSVPAAIILYLLTTGGGGAAGVLEDTSGPDRLAMHVLIMFLTACIGQSVGMLLGALFRLETAILMVPYANITFFFVNSYFVRVRDALPVVQAVARLSYFQYSFEGAISALYGYGRPDLPCDELFCYFRKPRKVLHVLDVAGDRFALDALVLGLWIGALNVTATDGDKDRPQNIVYFLTGQGIDPDNPANSKFDINRTTGEIFVLKLMPPRRSLGSSVSSGSSSSSLSYLKLHQQQQQQQQQQCLSPLDRDQPNGRPQWRFTVFAQDEGGEGLVGYADVQVNLKDINDNAPIFPQGVYFGNVTENGTAGMVVMTMTAVDYDDPNEGTNAKLIYSIEKNVIEEETGSPIFEIEADTGVIKTAVCCLDRERTPDYSIQVVAMDGGGLKGTGTASIRVKDINDMPPQFTKDEWFTEVDETDGTNLPEMPILTVTVHDEDETNKFQYKVIDNSGYGADKFTMVRNNDGTGSLKIVQPLDYEDPLQSNGFRFRIQVNDKGEDNDNDKYHVAYSWVVVKLRDINDNKPQFERPNIEVSVYENADVGKTLETFKATDPDQGGKSKVSYAIDRSSDRQRQFSINQEGTVTIQRNLDREVTPRHQVKILAIDDGIPPKTATATLTVIVQDINDNPPKFLKDYRPVLPEHVPPRKVVEILATDDDDRSKSNGPPFQFRLDPGADDIIRASFKVEQDQKGANGDGMAIVSSLRSFDREQQKEYLIPIVIKDHGNPAMTGTSTLTVVIGDVNDNKMQPGSKDIFVYNYLGQAPDTQIGRVYVYDLDDWDLPDKKFHWETQEHPRFKLDEDTGMITMRQGTRDGRYHLRFKVYDRKHTQADVPANVTVTVREIPHEAVVNSGSIRIAGITDEDFIRVWNYRTQSLSRSKSDRFKDKLADLLNIDRENVDVFSVQLRRKHPPLTDVRFSAHGSPYYKPVRLNGIVLMNREDIEKEVGINITMVGIDECLYENQMCEGSCTNTLDINSLPYMVNANKTSLVGVRVDVIAECTCGARNFSKAESCRSSPCHNGGRCMETRYGLSCSCPTGYTGPRCQQTTRSFRGNGWAWYPPLDMCDDSHLSFEFITRKSDGLLLYNGPIVPPERDELLVSDFISVELERGFPRLLIDFGSGTLELRVKTKKSLDDGEWHRLDVFWDTENVRMVVDNCRSAEVSEMEDGSPPEFDDSSCQARGTIPPFNEYLNVNAPLQIGGFYREQFDPTHYRWNYMPMGKGFDGCIKNLVHNSKLYDLAHPGLSRNSVAGCPQTEEVCSQSEQTSRCWEHGNCVGSFTEARCQCRPGWTGPACNIPTIPTTFKQQSYVKYALSFEPDRFSTQIQLRFRTREQHGELFRVSDQHNREYGILEIKDARLRFRYNLNSLRTEEKDIWLNAIAVDDGQWHVVRVNRHGSAATLELDGGEGRRYNETFTFEGHQWLLVDKQEGVYAGGKAEYTGVRTFEVYADYQKSCLDDIRLEGKHLPLPPAMNGTQWGQATMARNLERNCPSNKPCANVICPDPFECVDLWNEYECTPDPSVRSVHESVQTPASILFNIFQTNLDDISGQPVITDGDD
ncbi:cadherin [Anopheles darlingi]|uniref:Cadherin n=1 Tax=Anopheles darlingi TaxID=43151 RepID=W5JRM3_ANODA|nr:cadherin [Anopheles darlingi]